MLDPGNQKELTEALVKSFDFTRLKSIGFTIGYEYNSLKRITESSYCNDLVSSYNHNNNIKTLLETALLYKGESRNPQQIESILNIYIKADNTKNKSVSKKVEATFTASKPKKQPNLSILKNARIKVREELASLLNISITEIKMLACMSTLNGFKVLISLPEEAAISFAHGSRENATAITINKYRLTGRSLVEASSSQVWFTAYCKSWGETIFSDDIEETLISNPTIKSNLPSKVSWKNLAMYTLPLIIVFVIGLFIGINIREERKGLLSTPPVSQIQEGKSIKEIIAEIKKIRSTRATQGSFSNIKLAHYLEEMTLIRQNLQSNNEENGITFLIPGDAAANVTYRLCDAEKMSVLRVYAYLLGEKDKEKELKIRYSFDSDFYISDEDGKEDVMTLDRELSEPNETVYYYDIRDFVLHKTYLTVSDGYIVYSASLDGTKNFERSIRYTHNCNK